MLSKLGIIITLLLMSYSAWAMETIPLHNNASTTVKVSNIALNRIFVQNDRIISVKGMEGEYTLKQDDELGEIYLKPTTAMTERPITLFINTEGGSHYQLNLLSSNQTAETISIKPMDAQPIKASHWETALPYEQTLVNLLTAMADNKIPDGYAALQFKKPRTIKFDKTFTLTPLKIYKGEHLVGKVYLLKNNSDEEICIVPEIFDRPNVRALALDKFVIPAHGTAMLWVVTNHG